MGQCWLGMDSTAQALTQFTNAKTKKDPQLNSMALNNIGVLQAMNGENEIALASFKNALKSFHDNEHARYNYELLKLLTRGPTLSGDWPSPCPRKGIASAATTPASVAWTPDFRTHTQTTSPTRI